MPTTNPDQPSRDPKTSSAAGIRPHAGPFYVSVASTAIPAILLVALACGMPMTMVTVLTIIIPAMIVATVLLSVAMGWIFIMFGRTKQTPRWILGVGIMIAITMLELFAVTYISSLAKS
jgi:hypothetical protein